MMDFTEANVLRWMRRQAYQYEDSATGETNITGLAEGAAASFGQNNHGGPLDDESHWIWDLASRFSKL